MNDQTDPQLLRAYAEHRSEPAFAELVRRHVDFVYSAARRMVCDSHLAEDVTQAVFIALAKNAPQLANHPVLSGWLHRTAQNIAAQTVRTDVRRRVREQEAAAMNELLATEPDALWEQIAPLLDAALGELNEGDRDALFLRYFERKSAREMAEILGTSDDAAQKRVSRATERLREFFAKRGVTVGAGGLAVVISANAVQAAPAGLAVAISTAVALAGTTIATTVTKAIAMTALQKTIVAAVIVAAVGAGIYQAREASRLRDQVQELTQQQLDQQSFLSNQVQQLQLERDRATNQLAALSAENAALRKNPNEVLKLRGEVGKLRQENTTMGSSSALSKVTANPEAVKALREQQKMGMGMIYKGFADKAKLTPDQTEKLNDLLADHIMANVSNVTSILHDKPTLDQMNQTFAAQEAALQDKVQALIGPDGLVQYQDYTKNLLSTLSADQFKDMLTGTDAEKAQKSQQFSQAMQQATAAALASAGLPADYQVLPILNFVNIASEQQADANLKLLDDIYQRVAARGSSFLSPEELAKFQGFKTTAINGNRAALSLNRTMMAPISN